MLYELDEVKEHLKTLLRDLSIDGRMDDATFAVHLGHVYAHLNRVWHGRNSASELSDEIRDQYRQFPSDLTPVR